MSQHLTRTKPKASDSSVAASYVSLGPLLREFLAWKHVPKITVEKDQKQVPRLRSGRQEGTRLARSSRPGESELFWDADTNGH